PPNGSALHRRGAEQAEDELAGARGLEGAMGKIAVIEARDGEHAYQVEPHGDGQSRPAEAHPDDGETSGMHHHEGDDARPIDVPVRVLRRRGCARTARKIAAAEPAREFSAHPLGCGRRYGDFMLWCHLDSYD